MCLAFTCSFALVIIFVRFQAISVYLNVTNDDWVLDFSHCNAVNMDFFHPIPALSGVWRTDPPPLTLKFNWASVLAMTLYCKFNLLKKRIKGCSFGSNTCKLS